MRLEQACKGAAPARRKAGLRAAHAGHAVHAALAAGPARGALGWGQASRKAHP